jgi:hypothetical protein
MKPSVCSELMSASGTNGPVSRGGCQGVVQLWSGGYDAAVKRSPVNERVVELWPLACFESLLEVVDMPNRVIAA